MIDAITISIAVINMVFLITAFSVVKHILMFRHIKLYDKTAPEQLMTLYRSVCDELHIRNLPKLKVNGLISNSFITGLKHSTIYVPDTSLTDEDLYLIIKHELIHFKRKDLFWKAIMILATNLLWYNPMIYITGHLFDTECELSCDEAVIRTSCKISNITYAAMLVNLLEKSARSTKCFKMQLSIKGGYFQMSKRIKNIIGLKSAKNTGKPVLLLYSAAILLLFGFSCSFVVYADSITPDASALPDHSINQIQSSEAGELVTSDSIPDDIASEAEYVSPVNHADFTYLDDFKDTVVYDIPIGSDVFSVSDGVVIDIQEKFTGLGNFVVVKNELGEKYYYGNLESFSVDIGEKIKAGSKIATTGSTGRAKANGQCTFYVRDAGDKLITTDVLLRIYK